MKLQSKSLFPPDAGDASWVPGRRITCGRNTAFGLLDFERNALRDSDADRGAQDAVAGDLPLRSVLHHRAEEARPAGEASGHSEQRLVPGPLPPALPPPAGSRSRLTPWSASRTWPGRRRSRSCIRRGPSRPGSARTGTQERAKRAGVSPAGSTGRNPAPGSLWRPAPGLT